MTEVTMHMALGEGDEDCTFETTIDANGNKVVLKKGKDGKVTKMTQKVGPNGKP